MIKCFWIWTWSITFYRNVDNCLHRRADDARQPMSRIVPISSAHLTPYRVVIILRLIILGFFLQYRVTHPVNDAYPLWLVSVICEIWFAVSWLLDQFPKWYPINRETYLDRLAIRLVGFFQCAMYLSSVRLLSMTHEFHG